MDPSARIADSICALYCDVLDRSSVERDDDFFADLNGDSLAAAVVIVAIERRFQVEILEQFFKDSRPTALGRNIEKLPHARVAIQIGRPIE